MMFSFFDRICFAKHAVFMYRAFRWLLLTVCAWSLSAAAWAVNVNTATDQQLQQIKGIGPKTAALIVEERERGGPFLDFQDFQERVKGMGSKRIQTLQQSGLTLDSNTLKTEKK